MSPLQGSISGNILRASDYHVWLGQTVQKGKINSRIRTIYHNAIRNEAISPFYYFLKHFFLADIGTVPKNYLKSKSYM